MASRIIIVFCADQQAALPLAVAVRSVARHSSRRVDYYVVTRDLDLEQRGKLANCINRNRGDTLNFVDPARSFAGLPSMGGNSHATYFRLVLPEILQNVPRALYFDADLLIRSDLSELWDKVIDSNAPILACQDASPSTIGDATLPVYKEYGLELGMPYFNAGMLGLNLDLLRKEQFTERTLAFVKKHGADCPYHDQGAINALYSKRIERLPRMWNNFALVAARDAKIVHYGTWRKPFIRPRMRLNRADWMLAAWHVRNTNDLHYREYFEVLDETPYAGWRPTSASTRALRALPECFYPIGRLFFAGVRSVRRIIERPASTNASDGN